MLPQLGGTTPACRLLLLRLLLSVPPAPGYSLVMAVHAIDAVTGLGKHELVYAVPTRSALEAVGVVAIVARHDSFVEDRQAADAAAI